MDTIDIDPSCVTYAVIDSYAKKHFPGDYASLPDPNTIEIVTIPDEQFQPAGSDWPYMWDERVKIGQLIEHQGGISTTSSATGIYASAVISKSQLLDSDYRCAVIVRLSSSERKLSTEDWSNVQLIKPFREIQVGLKRSESVQRRCLSGMAIYYLMAKRHIHEFFVSSMEFLKDFKAACRCIAAMHQAQPALPLARDPALLPHSSVHRPTDKTKTDSTRTLKRRREDETEGSDRPGSSDQDAVEMSVSISRPCLDSSRC
jgi:hypothetical protein